MILQNPCLLLSASAFALHMIPDVSAEVYSWRNVSIGGGGYVTGIEFHPAAKGLSYARTDVGGAFRRDTAGGPWIPLNDSIGGFDREFMQLGVLSLALDPSDAGRVYLACGQYTAWWAPAGRFMSSSDRGATWRNIELPFKLGGNNPGRGTGERLAVDPRDGTRLLIGTTQDGIWRSTDRGVTWKRLAGFSPASTTFVRFDPADEQVIYAGAAQNKGGSLWRSSDGGETWRAVSGQPESLIALQSSFGPRGDLYVAFSDSIAPDAPKSGAVWKLDVHGSWRDLHTPGGQGGFAAVCADPNQPGRVIVSTLARWWPKDEIYQTDDDGGSWRAILGEGKLDLRPAPWATSLKPHWITDVEIDPFDSKHASFVTGYGIFSTGELGVSQAPSWSFDNRGLEECVPLALVSPAAGPPLVSVIGDFDGFRHDNLDVSPPGGRHAPHHGTTGSLDGAGKAPSVLAKIHHGGGAVTRDGGLTWKDFPNTPAGAADGHIAVSSDGAVLLWCPKEGAPHVSTDDGTSWKISAGCPGGKQLWPAADRVERLHFFIYDPATRRVFRSVDGGISFKPTTGELPEGGWRIAAVPEQSGHLWHAAGRGGLWRSADGGGKFHQASSVEAAYQVGFGRPAPGKSYPAAYMCGRVAGVDGLFRSDDAGKTWLRINDDDHRFGSINHVTGDPRVFGRVYLATSGRGVIVGEMAEDR